ncbi:polynucleotide kinase-phosphatase [Nocardia jinanensis]|uniref:Polynucleotide kinase-phosphatase n=1 Tax=Nocardia jinanensis TaxID=382504 RepID=A0A917RUE8_9NOCA|nr:polynucleotide kinase-phosphatase [Nocardia jinanensis]GGL34412.1 polynucleotide kinase-phosphatase [Nocardia jinanensis]
MNDVAVPDLCLVVLIGCTGSGKSTFARTHFPPTSVISSDFCRGLVSDDENDQAATPEAFTLLHHIVGVRLRRGLRTVVDATNVQPGARKELVALARAHDVLPVAIVLDVPDSICAQRNSNRLDRAALGAHVVHRQQRELRRGLRGLEREGFRRVHTLRGVEEIAGARIVDERLWTDRRDLAGPFDVIGDVHGCRSELETLLGVLGYRLERDAAGRAVGARHPAGRTAVFVGDLVDRGPDTPGVLRLVMGMVRAGDALCVTGNHENKLVRALGGKKVNPTHGLAESLAQLEAEDPRFRAAALDFCRGLISHYVLDGGRLVVAHAGLKEEYHGRSSGRVRSFAMYGESTGETDSYGLPVRYPWAEDYRGRAIVLYGHTPVTDLRWVNNTLCLDTGVVFGGRLSALRYPERQPVSVPAEQVWYEPVRPLTPAEEPGGAPVQRDPAILDLDDVIGRRVVETRHHGRVGIAAENAGAALEVMSRFAVDPRWLIYLPPTMAPCATSELPGYLEHPAQAFAYFRGEGVTRLVCQEKHMGSRAVVLVARSAAAARERFGVDHGTGMIYTRTGRPFFDDPDRTEALLARVRTAAETAGLFDELGTGWLLLDTELMPWSAKAQQLLRDQYAAVGAAGRASLDAATEVLAAAATRGQEVGPLRDRMAGRATDIAAFTRAYGRYCWPVEGLTGLRLAPFGVLAGEGNCYAVHDHHRQLQLIDRLVAADPALLAPTGRMTVDLTDPSSEAAATAWWTTLTGAGGEGMVVKPVDALVHGVPKSRPRDPDITAAGDLAGTGDGWPGNAAPGHADEPLPAETRRDQVTSQAPGGRLVQPGVKCRGPEYLRIIYGPEYLREDNLRRLRNRGLGRKRSMALREYALGIEALERFVSGEPLWRVHEAVFAVLALESEPVDPRL